MGAAGQASTSDGSRGPEFIDCDVHERPTSISELIPYLDEPWAGYVRTYPRYAGPDPIMYLNTAGGDRLDSRPSEKAPGGSDYGKLCDQLLDQYAVRYAILTGLFYPSVASTQPEFQVALARAYNDWVQAEWLSKDSRLLGSIHVAAQDVAAAEAEIERLAGNPQMAQVMLPVCTTDWGDPVYQPMFAAAARHRLPVAMHVCQATRGAIPLPRYYVSWHAAWSQNYMAHVIGLVYGGVFTRNPELKVVLLEGGWTWLPHLMWRMDRDWRAVRREVPWLDRKPSEYIRDHIRIGTQPLEEPESSSRLTDLLSMIEGEAMLVFASDYPHWDFDDPRRVLARAFPRDLQRRIFLDNAADLYSARLQLAEGAVK